MSFKTRSRCISSSTYPSSSSRFSTTLLTRRSPLFSLTPISTTSLIQASTPKTASILSRRPSSIILAISTSPSRLSRDTNPISRRYILTGSPVLPTDGMTPSISSSLATTISSVGFFTISFSPLSVSIISIFFSPKSMIISSI